jgi:acyl dehydratase
MMTLSQFPTPRDARYFEDYREGSIFEYGPATLTEHDIIAFARAYDPQTMHTDPHAAIKGPFGGLIASGWHTACVVMRLYVGNYVSDIASRASPGIDEMRWHIPVRPGDSLTLRVTVLQARSSRSKPDRGIVHSLLKAFNQKGEKVMSLRAMNLFAKRVAATASLCGGRRHEGSGDE